MHDSGPGKMRRKQVLFVHSGGSQGLHQGSHDLVVWLRTALGPPYEVIYPMMPHPNNPKYQEWKEQLKLEFTRLHDGIIIIGHSLGGSVILKFLSEEKITRKIDGLFIMGAPYWGKRNWKVNEFVLKHKFAASLPAINDIFLYHSRRDLVVPFSHFSYYAEQMPFANLRPIAGSEHIFSAGLPELVNDIKSLAAGHN
jgi:predicted alpha/beta hydrolase family esterase